MNTYFSTKIDHATKHEQELIISDLKKIDPNALATIQWNDEDDSLYSVSYLDESVDNPSDHGYIWHYELASKLLKEIEAQL